MLGAVFSRVAAAPVAPSLEIDRSRLRQKQLTTRYMLACLLRFHGTRHVELDKLPNLNEEIERKNPKRLLAKFDAFENDCLKIHFSTNQIQIILKERKKIELETNNHTR